MVEAPTRVPTWAILTILAAISCGVYFNTIQAGFTYDDFFALVGDIGLTTFDAPMRMLSVNQQTECKFAFPILLSYYMGSLPPFTLQ